MSRCPVETAQQLIAEYEEGERLKTLTNEQLVHECIEKLEHDTLVREICNRLSPGWLDRYEERSH